MATLLTFDKLKNHIQKGTIDTVLTCIVDMHNAGSADGQALSRPEFY